MDFGRINILLSQLLMGSTVSSLRIAGPELEVFFVGIPLKNVSVVSIDTDSWISVTDEQKLETEIPVINDEDFFSNRATAIVNIYELTGYDVNSVSIEENGNLEMVIGGKLLLILPIDDGSVSHIEKDSWSIITEDDNGIRRSLVNYDCCEFFVNYKNPLFGT